MKIKQNMINTKMMDHKILTTNILIKIGITIN